MTDTSQRKAPAVAPFKATSRNAAAVLPSSAPITTVTTDHSATTTSSSPNSKSYVGVAIVGTTIVGTLVLTAPFVLQYTRSPLPYMATPKQKVRKALQFVATRTMATRNPKHAVAIPPNQQHQQQHTKKECYHYNFVDLGSGDGEAVYQALQQRHPFTYHQATGIELNSTLWALSQLRRWLVWGVEKRRRSSFFCRDMFTYPVCSPPARRQSSHENGAESTTIHSTTVMIFGVKPLMTAISQKLARECVEGTHILAYRFPLPLLESSYENDTDETNDSGSGSSKVPSGAMVKEKRANGTEDDALLLAARLVYDVEEMRVYECLKQPEASTAEL